MDKNRRVRSRRGNVLGEKDRQKRPGTPHRNRTIRPPNLIRMTESAAPVHIKYPDYSEIEDEANSNLPQKESKLCQPQFHGILPHEENDGNNGNEEDYLLNYQSHVETDGNNGNQENYLLTNDAVLAAINSIRVESPGEAELEHSNSQESLLLLDPSLKRRNIIPGRSLLLGPNIPRGTSELRSTKAQPKCNDCLASQKNQKQSQLPKDLATNKTCQGSNTATTPCGSGTGTGLPPLEGVHAGVGIGPGYCEIGYDHTENLSDIYNLDFSETQDQDPDQEDVDDGFRAVITHRRLRVSNSIVFDGSSGNRKAFGGIIKLENLSEYFMTFCIKSSEPDMFSISPKVGLLGPMECQEIIIKTNYRYDFTFQDIANEVFKVFATPVYTRKQMELNKLEVLWRAYGSKLFPRIAAEEHPINFIYRYHSSYTKESILSAICSNHRWLSSFWGNYKDVVMNESGSQISEEEFYNTWPLEDDQYNFMSCRNQLEGWFWFLRKVKEETRQVKCDLRQCLGGFFMMLFVFLVVFSNLFSMSASMLDKYIQPIWTRCNSLDAEDDNSVLKSTVTDQVVPVSSVENFWSRVKEYITSFGFKI